MRLANFQELRVKIKIGCGSYEKGNHKFIGFTLASKFTLASIKCNGTFKTYQSINRCRKYLNLSYNRITNGKILLSSIISLFSFSQNFKNIFTFFFFHFHTQYTLPLSKTLFFHPHTKKNLPLPLNLKNIHSHFFIFILKNLSSRSIVNTAHHHTNIVQPDRHYHGHNRNFLVLHNPNRRSHGYHRATIHLHGSNLLHHKHHRATRSLHLYMKFLSF